jgi:hypothetical protein
VGSNGFDFNLDTACVQRTWGGVVGMEFFTLLDGTDLSVPLGTLPPVAAQIGVLL